MDDKTKEKVKIEGELRVKELLKERGIMMKDLAEKLNIARESLTRAIQGNPQYSTLKAIADELGVTVKDLFVDNEELSKGSKIHGYIRINDEIREITSKNDLQKIISILE